MGITSGPKSIRAFQEIRLEHRFQYPRDRSLQQSIFDRRNSERSRPCLARSLGYLHSAHRWSPIAPSLQAFAQLLNSHVQALFKLLRRLTIDTARTPPVICFQVSVRNSGVSRCASEVKRSFGFDFAFFAIWSSCVDILLLPLSVQEMFPWTSNSTCLAASPCTRLSRTLSTTNESDFHRRFCLPQVDPFG